MSFPWAFKSRLFPQVEIKLEEESDDDPLVLGAKPTDKRTESNPAATRSHRPSSSALHSPVNTLVIEDIFNIAVKDSGETTYFCKSCTLNFTDLGMVKKHISEHAEKRPFVCEHCPRKYKSAAQLRSHARIHGTDIYKYECEICGYCCTNKSTLDQHKRRHTSDSLVDCQECGKGYRSQIGLEAHINRVHRATTPFKCGECEQSFASKWYLYFHMRHVHPRLEDCVCEVCDEHFSSVRSWRRHRECHEKQTSYLCDLCGKSLSTQSSLVDHRRMHTGEKPFMCPHCGKAFAKSSALRFHVRIHTGERPYRCEICNKGFTQPSPYKIHMRTHTGERPYICDICQEGYVSRTALNSHLEVHRRTGKARPAWRKAKSKIVPIKSDTDSDACVDKMGTDDTKVADALTTSEIKSH